MKEKLRKEENEAAKVEKLKDAALGKAQQILKELAAEVFSTEKTLSCHQVSMRG